MLKLPVRGHRQFLLSLGLLRHGLIHCWMNYNRMNNKMCLNSSSLVLDLTFSFLSVVFLSHTLVVCRPNARQIERSAKRPARNPILFKLLHSQCNVLLFLLLLLSAASFVTWSIKPLVVVAAVPCNHQFKCLPVVHQTANDSFKLLHHFLKKNLFLFFFQTFCLKCDDDVKEMLSPTCRSK